MRERARERQILTQFYQEMGAPVAQAVTLCVKLCMCARARPQAIYSYARLVLIHTYSEMCAPVAKALEISWQILLRWACVPVLLRELFENLEAIIKGVLHSC